MLEGERIILRHIKKNDIDRIFDLMHQSPETSKTFPVSLLEELIGKKHFSPGASPGEDPEACLLITDQKDEIMGCIAYFKGIRYVEGYELSYHIFQPVHREQGYASEALKLLIAHLFLVQKVPRLQVNVEKGNMPSRNVVTNNRFKQDGTLRQAILSEGELKDIEQFSLMREEWLQR